MKILLTGAGGMVGHNILEHPRAADYDFLSPRRGDLDLAQKQQVDAYLSKHRPDLIIHASGRVGGIQANIRHPVEFLLENLDQGRNLVMSAHEHGIQRLLNFGSTCMYPRQAASPLTEDLILHGELEPTNEGYALAKITIARLCQYLNRQYGRSYKTLIPCNLYGRHDKFDPKHSHLIPAIIAKIDDALLSGSEEVGIWGTGEARREFLYAGDLAEFVFQALARYDEVPELVNVGYGNDFSVNDYYQAVATVIGYRGRFTHDLSRPVGMARKLSSTVLAARFGWHPKTSLEEGLRLTCDYYQGSKGNLS